MKQLEQILETVKSNKYKTIDIYAIGTIALYTAPAPNFNFPLAYNDSASSPLERQSTLFDYGIPEMKLPEFRLPEIIPILKPISEENSPYCVKIEPNYLDGGFERFRKPEFDNRHGYHMNYELGVPGIKESLTNYHIDLDY
jgi:hypothetical protein